MYFCGGCILYSSMKMCNVRGKWLCIQKNYRKMTFDSLFTQEDMLILYTLTGRCVDSLSTCWLFIHLQEDVLIAYTHVNSLYTYRKMCRQFIQMLIVYTLTGRCADTSYMLIVYTLTERCANTLYMLIVYTLTGRCVDSLYTYRKMCWYFIHVDSLYTYRKMCW